MSEGVGDTVRTFVREALTKNVKLKILAVFISFAIFIFVQGGRDETTRIDVDVEAITPAPTSSRILITELPDSVTLRVRGSRRMIQIVEDDPIAPVTLDFRESREGTFVLDYSLFIVSPGLEIVSVTPSAIDLVYEQRVWRSLPIQPSLSGEVAVAHHVKAPVKTTPQQVALSGPKTMIEGRDLVETEPILIDGLGEGRHLRRVNLEPLPEHCRYERTKNATVLIEVEPDIIEREIKGIPVDVREAGLPAKAEPIIVVLRGAPDVVRAIKSEEITAYVVLGDDGDEPGTYRRPVRISGVSSEVDVRLVPSAVIVDVAQAIEPEDPQAGTDGDEPESP